MRKFMAASAGLMVALAITSACDASSGAGGGDGENYPDGQIAVVSPFDPGGGIDLAINTMISSLNDSGASDASMRLENIPGGSGMVATSTLAADNNGDPNTLLLTSVSTLSASIQDPANTSLLKMTPLGGLYAEYTYVYVPKDSPFTSIKDVADALKANPDDVVIGGASLGSADNLVVAQLAKDLGLSFDQLAYVPLAGDENAANLLGGQVDVTFGGPDLLDLVDSGDVRVLAVSAPKRLEIDRVKDIPTFIESGYQVSQANWRGLFGPPDMPQYAVDYWNEKLAELSKSAEWQSAAEKNVWDLTSLDREEFAKFLETEKESLTGLLGELGLT
jgi:putative tricarboxylic transport membrane protein